MKKNKRTQEDFNETLALIFKYKAVETSLKKAEYFVNVSYDALAIFPDNQDKRTEKDFSETLALIFKYKTVETSLNKAEYFVNVSYDALAIFPDSEDKSILQNLTSFSLNRSF